MPIRWPLTEDQGLFLAGCVAGIVVALRLYLDVDMIALGLVKLELGNALQLEQHAGIREGVILLQTDAELPYRALHHWFLHLPMLISPRPEAAAAFLVFVDFLTAGVWFSLMSRRYGRLSAFVVVALYLATPVAPILSKHVISTAFVPMAGAFFLEGLLRLGGGEGRSGLKMAMVSFGFLLVFNMNHILLLFPLVFALRKGPFRPIPFAGLGLVLFGGWPLFLGLESGPWKDAWDAMMARPGFYLESPESFFRRMVFVEPYMTEMVPWLYVWPLVLGVSLVILARHWRERPRGLVPFLLTFPLFLWVGDLEATVVWQAGLFALLAWAVHRIPHFATLGLGYGLVAQAVLAYTFLTFGPPPQMNFFSLSTVAQKEQILDVLETEFSMGSDELKSLSVFHEIGENGTPAPVPGLRYLADCCREFPPGGTRCLRASQSPLEIPAGATEIKRLERGGFHYVAWVGGPPCTTNLIHPLPKAVYYNWKSNEVTDEAPWRRGTDLPLY